jgi:hypothetical protein
MPDPSLRKLIVAMDEQFLILEYMYLVYWPHEPTILVFPGTSNAPNLHHIRLQKVSFPIGLPSVTTTVGLVHLWLEDILASPHNPQTISLPGFHLCSSWRCS